jgi:hypothetical protein
MVGLIPGALAPACRLWTLRYRSQWLIPPVNIFRRAGMAVMEACHLQLSTQFMLIGFAAAVDPGASRK